ncbi:MAG: hypothetical protein ACR2N3_19055 [Pyrinomonadaceae bacterium]
MKNRDTQNKRLNDIERKMLEAAMLPNEEIEKIVGKPQLFNSVMARIEVEKLHCEQEHNSASRKIFPIRNWRKIGYSFGILAILSLAAGVLLIRQTSNSAPDLMSEKIAAVKPLLTEAASNFAPSPDDNPPTTDKMTNNKSNKIFASKKLTKKENVKIQKSPERKSLTKPSPPVMISEEKVFYSLVFPGNPAVETGERQIVRTELSRAALFALGVNVTAGNDDNRKFKTDLIVGADGVPQAIRFVE